MKGLDKKHKCIAEHEEEKQRHIDRFYRDNGECCAGCDSWRWHNTAIGECIKSQMVAGSERTELESISMPVAAGHVFTSRDYYCGNFSDNN